MSIDIKFLITVSFVFIMLGGAIIFRIINQKKQSRLFKNYEELAFEYKSKYDENLKKVKMTMMSYWDEIGMSRPSLEISDIELSGDMDGDFIIHINLGRPGLLLGYHGRHLEGLKKEINLSFERNVEIKIKECDMWHNLY